MTRFDLTTIGEGGLRLSVEAGTRLEATDHFAVHVVGAEANVASTVASLGWRSAWLSSLDSSPLGRRVARELLSHGVDLDAVSWLEDTRTGIYFVEYAEPPRSINVHYDRAGTAFSRITPAAVDWLALLDTQLIHLSGLTTGLGDGPRSVIAEAVERARAGAVPYSFDVNYRSNLQTCSEAAEIITPLLYGAELVFCREDDARRVFGLSGDRKQLAAGLAGLSRANHVIMSLSADGLAHLHDDHYLEHPTLAVGVVDRLGAGDALAAGVIHAWLNGDMTNAPQIGSALAALSLSQVGEQVITTRTEVERLVTDATVRLRR